MKNKLEKFWTLVGPAKLRINQILSRKSGKIHRCECSPENDDIIQDAINSHLFIQ